MSTALPYDHEAYPDQWPVLVAVLMAHAALLAAIAFLGFGKAEPPLTPPTVMGVLVPMTPPAEITPPKPPEPKPELPKPKPVVQPRPVAPLVKAPPTERSITTPRVDETSREEAKQTNSAAAPAQPAAQSQAPAPAPLIPPRTDAAHLNNPAPNYPPLSRKMGEQGTVTLDVHIQPDGSVSEVKLKRSSGYSRLDDAAVNAVSRWRYVPARRGNEPIAFWYVQPIKFALDN